MRLAKLVVLLLVLGSASSAQFSPKGGVQDHPEPFRIAVNVDLVVLHATLRDRKGRIVPDLPQQEFGVYEDGVRQSIRLFKHEDAPVTV